MFCVLCMYVYSIIIVEHVLNVVSINCCLSGNTLLHIFGNWLFEAAVWEGQDQEGFPQRRRSHSSTTVISSTADITRLKETGHLSASQQSMQQRVCVE